MNIMDLLGDILENCENRKTDRVVIKIDDFEFETSSENHIMKVHKQEGECDCLMCKCYFAVKEITMAELNNSEFYSISRNAFNEAFKEGSEFYPHQNQDLKKQIEGELGNAKASLVTNIVKQFRDIVCLEEVNKRLEKLKKTQDEKDVNS